MRKLSDIPIKQKLMIIIMITTSAALLLAGIGIVASDAFLFRGYLKRDLSTLAHIIADNSTAALAFNDPQAATDTLAALRARTHLIAACIYRMDGSVLAHYARSNTPAQCPAPGGTDEISFGADDLTVSRAILLSGRRIGTLTLRYELLEISERIQLYGATVLGVLLLSSFLAFVLSSRLREVIAMPVFQLVRATTAVSDTGDYSIRAHRVSGDELGILVDRFNEMLSGIQSRNTNLKTALRQREEALSDAKLAWERFHFMAESMPQKIFATSSLGGVDYINRQWMEFTGYTYEQIRHFGWTQFVHPDDLDANIQTWQRALESGEPFLFEHRFRRADGVYRWHLSRAHAMRGADGHISMWIGSSTDIDEQKQKEQELRRANEDLQQFAYSASHDLQEPIRNVAVYSEIVAQRYHEILDAEGRQFLGFLTEGGRRLGRLIHDLLAYTRAGIVEGNTAPVDSSEVLRHSLASLAEAIRESKASIIFDPLPEVYMGEAHLQQLFQNLISNALKYRSQVAPQIHISATHQGAVWRFSVQDNGIGIDPQYKEKIFGVFKRLHRDEKYSGTGIGLAICQRVVERYGGRIWVDSEPGKGSTFYFTVRQGAVAAHSAASQSIVG